MTQLTVGTIATSTAKRGCHMIAIIPSIIDVLRNGLRWLKMNKMYVYKLRYLVSLVRIILGDHHGIYSLSWTKMLLGM